MAPLGLGSGFYGIGPTISSDNATILQQFGDACRFSGSTDQENALGCIFIDNDFQTTIRGNFTVSFWVKHGDGREGEEGVVQYYFGIGMGNSSSTQIKDEFGIQENGGNGKIACLLRANGDLHLNLTDAAHIADGPGPWQHIAVTVTKNSSADTTSEIYVDGVPVGTSTTYLGSTHEITDTNQETFEATSPQKTNIGSTAGTLTSGSVAGLDGDIKEVAIWNVALDAAAIAKIEDLSYTNPNLLVNDGDYDVSGNLVGYWKLNDYSGLTAVDSKGSNDGTLVSFPYQIAYGSINGIDFGPFFV